MINYNEAIKLIKEKGVFMEEELIETKNSSGRVLAGNLNQFIGIKIENKKCKCMDNIGVCGQYYRRTINEDYVKINSSQIGLLSSLGINKIKVMKKPTIGIISIGNEMEENLNSNLYYLYSKGKSLGCVPYVIEEGLDSKEKLLKGIKNLERKCSFIITVGEVNEDFKRIVNSLNYVELFDSVNINENLSISCREKEGKLIFSLPKKIEDCVLTFELYIRKYISHITHCRECEMETITGFLKNDYAFKSEKRNFIKVYIRKEAINLIYLYDTNSKEGEKEALANFNGILEIPPKKELKKGEKLKVYLI